MIMNCRIREEAARTISALLMNVLEASRQGDVALGRGLGFGIDTVRNLDKLKADQITQLASSYLREGSALELFNVDSQKMSRVIEMAVQESKVLDLIDEYLIHGACKKMMGDIFGLRSTQISTRKRLLNIETIKGRMTVVTIDEEERIYHSWIKSIAEQDVRIRYLSVAKETNLSLAKVYRVVQEIEIIENQKNVDKKYA